MIEYQDERVAIFGMPLGPIQANCFVFADKAAGEAALIDPGDPGGDAMLLALAERKLKVTTILATHGHVDHAAGVARMKRATGAPFLIHESEADSLKAMPQIGAMFGVTGLEVPEVDRTFKDGDAIAVGALSLKVIHTPGHSPGGSCFLWEKHLFVGDTIFQGSIGRTDLPGGSYKRIIDSIKTRIVSLPDDTTLYPGHGPETTVAFEKRSNPFVLNPEAYQG